MKYVTARRSGLLACQTFGLGERLPGAGEASACSRCGTTLHARQPDSIMRTWALLIAAALLYLPANLLPVMHTSSLFGSQDDPHMSGIIYFGQSGDWPLACIVFIASILVPMIKLLVLTLLALTAQLKSRWRPQQRT